MDRCYQQQQQYQQQQGDEYRSPNDDIKGIAIPPYKGNDVILEDMRIIDGYTVSRIVGTIYNIGKNSINKVHIEGMINFENIRRIKAEDIEFLASLKPGERKKFCIEIFEGDNVPRDLKAK